jgi:hypothetical protein
MILEKFNYHLVRHNLFRPMIIGLFMEVPRPIQVKKAIEGHDFIEVGEDSARRIVEGEHVRPYLQITYFIEAR